MPFDDRTDAGRRLAVALEHLRGQDLVVLALPRGGVPVAAEVAHALIAPLDVVLVRKLLVPSNPDLAMGAIGEGDVRVLNDAVLRTVHLTPTQLQRVIATEGIELERRRLRYRRVRPRERVAGRTALIIDDGIANGSTVRAACQIVRVGGARRVVVAVPVAPPAVVVHLLSVADEVVSVETPRVMGVVGDWYTDFPTMTDEDVVRLLSMPAAV